MLDLRGGNATPLIHQAGPRECGLACLAMIAGHHGLDINLPVLRRRFWLSAEGVTLKTLILIAGEIGLNSRALRGEVEHLEQLQLPAILHWNRNHFVVLSRVCPDLEDGRFEILDPARGRRLIAQAELSRHFTGVVMELTKPSSADGVATAAGAAV